MAILSDIKERGMRLAGEADKAAIAFKDAQIRLAGGSEAGEVEKKAFATISRDALAGAYISFSADLLQSKDW